jgi:hypothetical protein
MLVFLAGVVVGVVVSNVKNIVLAVKAAHKATVTKEPVVTVVNTPIVTTAPKVGE